MTTEHAVIRDGARPDTEADSSAASPRPAGGPMLRSALGILAAAAADPWGHGIEALRSGVDAPQDGSARTLALPRLSGFVESVFSPLAYEVSRRCLAARPGDGARTAVVLASLMGDITTFDLASRRMLAGRVHNPLLFMQSTANAVLGYLSQEFGITAQTISLSTLDDPAAELLAMADLLLEDPELDRVLVVGVELSNNERAAAVHRELAAATGRPQPSVTPDLAVALLLGRDEPGQDPGAPGVSIRSVDDPAGDTEPTGAARTAGPCGSLRNLLEVAAAYERLRSSGGGCVLVTDPAARSGAGTFSLTATAHVRPEEENHDQ